MFDLHEEAARREAATATTTGPATNARSGLPVEPGRLLRALTRGKKTLAIAGVLGLIAGVGLAKTVVPREYTSTATILWEPGTPLAGEVRQDGRELRTLVDSIKVPGNLAEARRRLELPATVGDIGSRINVASNEKSNLVSIAATWTDPETAPRIANTMVDIFLERRLDIQRERADALLKNVTEGADTARKKLAEARKVYDDFRAEHGVADLPVETQVAIEQAAKLRAEADAASAEAQGEEARALALRTAAQKQAPTAVISTTEMRPQAMKLAEAQAELAGLRATLSPEHPKVQALAAQADGLKQGASEPKNAVLAERVIGRNPQLDAIQQILAGSTAQREAALKRQAALTELARAANERIAKLSVIEGRASELLAAVRVAEAHLNELEKVRAQAADLVRAPASGFRVADTAIRPEMPSKSRRKLFAAAVPIGAVLLAGIYLLARALQGLRVHTARELAFWGKGPVIASSRYPLDPGAKRDLTVDLWAYGVQTRGKTLVVPMSAAERDLSNMVAAALNPPEVSMSDDPVVRSEAVVSVWDGADAGPELRRAARLADRVVVVVTAGKHSAPEMTSVHDRVGRTGGVGYILLGVGEELSKLPDRAGDVGGFIHGGAPELAAAYEVSHV
jgi:uncharacterized protein involved in exopolysaccharide biosynthesis